MRTNALVTAIAVALALLTIAYRLLTMGGPLGGFENDQFVTLSQAQQVVMGDWPMRDFIEFGMPLTVMLSVAGQIVFGHTLFAEALLTSGVIGLCTAILFVLSWRASGSIVIAVLVALMQIAMAPRFYNHQKLLAYAIAIPVLWWYLEQPNRRRLIAVAAAGAVAFLLRHDHGVYVGVSAIVAVALVHPRDVRRTAADVTWLGAMAFAFVLPYLLFVQVHGGLAPYVQSFVRYANQTARRTTTASVRMSFDWSRPLLVRVPAPRPQPRINVRWANGVTDAQRADRERALGLVNPEPRSADVINYAVIDGSTSRLAAIVHDPAIADTAGIDRESFVLNDPAYTHAPTTVERAIAYAGSIRVLPGILHGTNAVPFLYDLLYALPLVALVMAAYQRNLPMVIVAVLALLIDRGFLRGNLESRLADVTEAVGVLAAWVAAVILARRTRGARAVAAIALVLVFIATAMSVQALEHVSGQIVQTGVTTGAGSLRTRARGVHEALTAMPPVAAWPPDAPGMEGLARYINACTVPDDRVLGLGYMPELFFLSQRRFAAGSVWIQPRFFDTPDDQKRMIERVRRERVPIVITVPEPEYTAEYVADFPLLTTFLRSEYREVGEVDFGRGFRFRVLSRRDLAPARVSPWHQLPCFS